MLLFFTQKSKGLLLWELWVVGGFGRLEFFNWEICHLVCYPNKRKVEDAQEDTEGWFLWFQEEKDRGCSRCWWRRRTWSWGRSTQTLCSLSSSAPSVSIISPLPSNSAPRWTTTRRRVEIKTEMYPGSLGLHRLLPPFASLSNMSISNGRGEELGDGAGKKVFCYFQSFLHYNNCLGVQIAEVSMPVPPDGLQRGAQLEC